MVHPIPCGTLLRQRYLIQKVLGQGGFSRTYLALDQERFHELCVLKELTVPYQDDGLVAKSRNLFQREASILYQIQHPQIPRFWAAFEDEQRLFLVQSFIEGPTYRAVLCDRQQTGETFSEAEILHFLNYLLPVLTYIHERDIIHRDISPDNLILRLVPSPVTTLEPSPRVADLPVLIDFGAVKEATSHWPMITATTRVGKVGYAPPEQLQTGKVYPNSDLYALAASCLALLTGREPRTLLDSQTLTWHWEGRAQISPELGRILKRMLAVYPSDRFSSAKEVWAAIQTLVPAAVAPTLVSPALRELSLPTMQPQPFVPNQATAQATQLTPDDGDSYPMQNASDSHPASQSLLRTPAAPAGPRRRSPSQKNRLIPISIAAGIAALGVATPNLWSFWANQPGKSNDKMVWVAGAPMKQEDAEQLMQSQPNAASTPFNPSSTLLAVKSQPPVTTNPNRPVRWLKLNPQNLSSLLQGNLEENDQQSYSFEGSEGQVVTLNLSGSEVTLNVLNSRQQSLNESAQNTRRWTGQLPANDHYYIQVVGTGAYTLDVAFTPPSAVSQTKPYPILFNPGTTSTKVMGTLLANGKRRYELRAAQGQVLTVRRLQGKVAVRAIAPNKSQFGRAQANRWEARLPVDGDYQLEVTAPQAQDYVLLVEIR